MCSHGPNWKNYLGQHWFIFWTIAGLGCWRIFASLDLNDLINTLRPRQNGRHFADDIFKCIFLNENVWIPIEISLKFIPKGPINNIAALFQIMAWRRSGDKPLSEPMMIKVPTDICVARPQWVKVKSIFHWTSRLQWIANEYYQSVYLISWVKKYCVTVRKLVITEDTNDYTIIVVGLLDTHDIYVWCGNLPLRLWTWLISLLS